MKPDNTMAVGELARRTGVTTAAINFYVREGLLPRPPKTGQTRAVYDVAYVDRINRIRELQRRGLPLRVIARVLDSPDPIAELGLLSPGQPRAATAPVGVEEYLEQTGLSRDELVRLTELGLLRPRPRASRGEEPLFFDGRDTAVGKALARLIAAGVGFDLFARHADYDPLTEAEAHFLAEHVAAVVRKNPSRRAIAETAAAFARLRDYLRIRKLLDEYPQWRPEDQS